MTLEALHFTETLATPVESDEERLLRERKELQVELGRWSVLLDAASQGRLECVGRMIALNDEIRSRGIDLTDYIRDELHPAADMNEDLFGRIQDFITDETEVPQELPDNGTQALSA
jgi:hypothetical protein